MSFAIIAELPLGVYYGGVGDGETEVLPSPARLHAALLCAAAQGPRALPNGDLLTACDEDQAALRWLEQHPPDGVRLPTHSVNPSSAIAYRKLGLLEKNRERIIGKTAGSVAVDGPYAWTWTTTPTAEVRTALRALCADVSHLGQAQTPVRLTVGDIEPSHHLDPDADLFSGTGVDVDVSAEGRTDALVNEYVQANATPPKVSADGVRSKEDENKRPVVRTGLAPARYVDPEPAPSTDPWTHVLLVPLRSHPPRDWMRVRWAVALHRALISLIGDGAPAVITGAYPPGVPQPANRVAIHPIAGCQVAGWNDNAAGFAVLLPRNAEASEVEALASAARTLRLVKGPRGKTVNVDHRAITVRSTAGFWPPPAAGYRRQWVTTAVPETRGFRSTPWSLADAVQLSVGLVWRDELVGGGGRRRGEAWYRQVADAAAARGVRVRSVHRITDGDLGRFVHKISPDSVVQPYRAELTLGDLAGHRTLLAIGQSRHLGGGLLIPCDRPETDGAS